MQQVRRPRDFQYYVAVVLPLGVSVKVPLADELFSPVAAGSLLTQAAVRTLAQKEWVVKSRAIPMRLRPAEGEPLPYIPVDNGASSGSHRDAAPRRALVSLCVTPGRDLFVGVEFLDRYGLLDVRVRRGEGLRAGDDTVCLCMLPEVDLAHLVGLTDQQGSELHRATSGGLDGTVSAPGIVEQLAGYGAADLPAGWGAIVLAEWAQGETPITWHRHADEVVAWVEGAPACLGGQKWRIADEHDCFAEYVDTNMTSACWGIRLDYELPDTYPADVHRREFEQIAHGLLAKDGYPVGDRPLGVLPSVDFARSLVNALCEREPRRRWLKAGLTLWTVVAGLGTGSATTDDDQRAEEAQREAARLRVASLDHAVQRSPKAISSGVPGIALAKDLKAHLTGVMDTYPSTSQVVQEAEGAVQGWLTAQTLLAAKLSRAQAEKTRRVVQVLSTVVGVAAVLGLSAALAAVPESDALISPWMRAVSATLLITVAVAAFAALVLSALGRNSAERSRSARWWGSVAVLGIGGCAAALCGTFVAAWSTLAAVAALALLGTATVLGIYVYDFSGRGADRPRG